jgi:hypothetical protein
MKAKKDKSCKPKAKSHKQNLPEGIEAILHLLLAFSL